MKQLVVFLFLLFSSYCLSQGIPKYGFKAGANFSDLTFEGKRSADTRSGFVAGFFINYGINEKFRVQPEFIYSSQGSKQFKIEYLQLPVMLKYKIKKTLNVQLGPEVGVKIHEFEDGVRNISYGVNAGIGIGLLDNLDFEIRYGYGLSQIFDEVTLFQDSKNRYVQVTLAYSL